MIITFILHCFLSQKRQTQAISGDNYVNNTCTMIMINYPEENLLEEDLAYFTVNNSSPLMYVNSFVFFSPG